MRKLLTEFVRGDEAQDLIEYAFLGCAIALAAIAGAELLGTTLNNWYSTVAGTTDAGAAKAISVSF